MIIAIGAITILAFISYVRMNALIGSSAIVNHTNVVKYKLEEITSAINEAESDQRGYMLSSDSSFLKGRTEALLKLNLKITILDSLITDNKQQQKNIGELKGKISKRIDALNKVLQSISPQRNYTKLMNEIIHGKQLMKEVKSCSDKMSKAEDELLQTRTLDLEKQKDITPVVLFLFIVAALFILVLSFYELTQQYKKTLLLQKSERHLKAKVQERMAELKQRNSFIEAIIESSHEWIAVYNKNYTLISVNNATTFMLKRSKEELLGKTLFELFPEAKGTKAETDLTKALNGEVVQNDPYRSSVTGSYIQNYITPLRDENGNVYAALAIATDVTKIKKAEEELKKSQQYFSLMFNVSPVAMSLSYAHDGTVLNVNNAWEKMFLKTHAEAIGKNADQIGISNAAERAEKANQIKQAGGAMQGMELKFRLTDGRTIYTSLSAETIVLDGKQCFLAAFIDITERKQAEEKIKTINQQLNEAQRQSHIGSWEWDIVNNKIAWSDELYRIYGLTHETFDTTYENYLTTHHPEDSKWVSEIIQSSYRTHEPYTFIHRIVRPDGTVRILQAKGEVFTNDKNEAVRMAGTAQDITEAVKAEEEIKKQAQKVIQQNVELEKINKELASFSYVASHDLQEPLRKIQSFSKLILDTEAEKLTERGKDYFNRSISASQRMQGLINSLLSFSRASQVEVVSEEVNLNNTLSEVRAELKEIIEQKNAILESDDLPSLVAVPVQMNQLFLNLIGNSLKYSRKEVQPIIKIKSERVSSDHSPLHVDTWKISMEDNGIGFEQQFGHKIFELFQRLHGRADYEGTGIGLAICKKIVENHKGTITAQGISGNGAIFTIFLPENKST